MTPLMFLRIGGVLSLLIGLWGIVEPEGLGTPLYFDLTENIVHTGFGIALLGAGFLDAFTSLRRPLVWFTGVASLIAGIVGLLVAGQTEPNVAGLTNLEHPIDNLIHLFFGTWALFVAQTDARRMRKEVDISA